MFITPPCPHLGQGGVGLFGKNKKMADWFEAHSEELMPAVEEKRRALAAYKACPSEYNLQALRVAYNKVQQAARRCSNDYWLQLSDTDSSRNR